MLGQKRETINSIIGEHSVFSGKFQIKGSLQVDGKFEGVSITVNHLHVGIKGKIKSTIKAQTVIVEGIVIGTINAQSRVFLMPTARILGTINTPELIIQKGVMLDGKIAISERPDKSSKELINQLYNNKT